MKILLSTKISYDKKNKTFINIIDKNILKFLNKIFIDSELHLYDNQKQLNRFDIYITFGGNNLPKFSNKLKDKIRFNLEKKAVKAFIENKKPIIGICYGAQILAYFFKAKIKKIKNHANKKHFIKLNHRELIVNSYHDYAVYELNKDLYSLATAKDGTHEAFININKKILGIMWHPERNKIFKKTDIKLIKDYLEI